MAGRFEGVSDLEWRLFEDVFPPAPSKRGRGMPHASFRKILNTLLYILITGCRWCDVPRGLQWGSKSATHRWLQRWQADGTLAAMQARILGVAEERGMIRWEYGAIDGAFSPCAYSTTKLPPIPGESCHRFHGNTATCSTRTLPLIP